MIEDMERQLEQHYQNAAFAEHNVPEMKLDNSIRAGLTQGKRARLQHRRSVRLGTILGAAMLFILLIMGWTIRNPFHTSSVSKMAIPEYVEKLIDASGSSIRRAADHGLYQPVGKSAAYKGFHVTVDGMLADNHRMILFFSSQNKQNDEKIVLKEPQILSTDYDKLSSMRVHTSSDPGSGYQDGNIYHGMIIVDLEEGAQIPDEFILGGYWSADVLTKEQAWLGITIPVSRSSFADLEQTFELNKTIDIQGQKMKVSNVAITPLRTDVVIDLDPSNKKLIRNLLNPGFYASKTNGSKNKDDGSSSIESLYLQGIEDMQDDSGWSIHFDGSYYSDYNGLVFQADGIQTIPGRDMELVIDTDKKRIINKPDDKLMLKSIEKGSEYTRMTFGFQSKVAGSSQNLGIENSFIDGEGNVRTMLKTDTVMHAGHISKEGLDESYFDLKHEEYPQPLTFRVYEYPADLIQQPFVVQFK